MIARIAWGLARSFSLEHRWRRVAVPLSAAICLVLVLTTAGVVALVGREAERARARTALRATTPAPTDVFFMERDDDWRGEQFPVNWIEPAGTGPPVLARGMREFPKPGQAVVSPALDRLAAEHEELASRYPNRLVLGWDGVASGDELLAHVRVPENRTLTGAVQEEVASRVRGFGAPAGEDAGRRVGYYEPLPMAAVVAGLFLVLVLPGVIVLAVGVSAASAVRDHRFGVLRWLGAPVRTLAALAVLETMLLAIPGFVGGAVLWAAVAPRLDRVPFVGYAVVPGDLAVPWLLLLELTAACIAVTVLLSLVVTMFGERRGSPRIRPGVASVRPTPLRVVPLLAALGIAAYGATARTTSGDLVLLGGIGAMVVAAPLVLPNVLRAAGERLRRRDSVPALVAGRGMAWDPIRTARPFAVGAALVVLALAGNGWLAFKSDTEASALDGGAVAAVKVWWYDPQPGDRDRLASVLGSGLVVPFSHDHGHGEQGSHHGDEAGEGGALVGATCRQLAPYLSGVACRPDAPYALPHDAAHALADALGEPGTGAALVPPGEIAGRSAVVFDRAPLGALHERVRTAAMRVLPAPTVQSRMTWVGNESPLVRWLVGGLAVALVALTIGGVLSMVDRLLATQSRRRHLLALGLDARRLAALEMWLFAAPFAASAALGVSAGLALCALISLRTRVDVPWEAVRVVVGSAVLIGLLGTAAVALFGVWSLRDRPRKAG